MQKGFVYILQSAKTGRYYIGSTVDIARRLRQHQRGHTSTTRRMQDIVVRHIQEYEDIKRARDIERKLKRLKRKDYIDKIIKEGHIRMQ